MRKVFAIFVYSLSVITLVGIVMQVVDTARYASVVAGAKVIYKLAGDHYDQVTDIGQIKDGIYIFIR